MDLCYYFNLYDSHWKFEYLHQNMGYFFLKKLTYKTRVQFFFFFFLVMWYKFINNDICIELIIPVLK